MKPFFKRVEMEAIDDNGYGVFIYFSFLFFFFNIRN